MHSISSLRPSSANSHMTKLVMLGAYYYYYPHYFYCAAVLSVYLCCAQLPCHLVGNIMVLINAHYVLEFSCDSSLSAHRPVVRGVIVTLLKGSSQFKISLSTHSESSCSTIRLKG